MGMYQLYVLFDKYVIRLMLWDIIFIKLIQ